MDEAKTFKYSPDSKAGIRAGGHSVRMHGNEDNYVLTDEHGTSIGGPMSLVCMPDQIRVASLFTFNSLINLMIPSTIATPSPVLKFNPPIHALTGLMKDVALIGALYGIMSAL